MKRTIKGGNVNFEVVYEMHELANILRKCRAAITEVNQYSTAENMVVCMPEYFRQLLSQYFLKEYDGQALGLMVFGSKGSVFGVKNFFPSHENAITIYSIQEPTFKEPQKIVIELKSIR